MPYRKVKEGGLKQFLPEIVLLREQGVRMSRVAEVFGCNIESIRRMLRPAHQHLIGTDTRKSDLESEYTKEHISDWDVDGCKWVRNYLYLHVPDHPIATKQGYVLYHRLVLDKKIGRLLSKSEVVHHIDDDTKNNHPDNLQLFSSNGEHLRVTRKGKQPNVSPDGVKRRDEGRKNRWRRYRQQLATKKG